MLPCDPAFANLAALEQGKAIHESINRSEFHSDAIVGCTLVDTCVECGSIKDEHNVFDKIAKQDGSHFSCNDFGNSMHGHGKEALQLFEQKQNPSVKPNNVIFVGVLYTCCQAGLVDEGLNGFGVMTTFSHHI